MENITVGQLYSLHPDDVAQYRNVLQDLRPRDYVPAWPYELGDPYRAKSLFDMSFGDVVSLKTAINGDIAEAFRLVFGITTEYLINLKVVDFFHAFNWMRAELGKINEAETIRLGGISDAKWEQAGAKRLGIFRELNVLISIAKMFGCRPQDVQDWKYSLVFSLLLHDKVHGEVTKEFYRLKNQ